MEVYKRFFIKTLILMLIVPFIIAILGLFLSNYFIGKGFICYGESQMVHKWIIQKNNAAKKINSKKKIVFISGSNALFGVNAKLIEDKTGISTLNYATHAGLSSYIFYNAKRILKPHDIVFLPLEYDFYKDSYEINSLPSALTEYVIGYDNEYYRALPIKGKLKILAYLIRLNTITSFWEEKNGYYPKLNIRGDVKDGIITNKKYKKTAKPEKINLNPLSDNYTKWDLYKFIQWCKMNNIQVYACAPNIYHEPTISKKEQTSFEFIEKFYKWAGVKFVGDFKDGFWELKYMNDSRYHLNSQGRKIRSNYFIKKIQNLVKSDDF